MSIQNFSEISNNIFRDLKPKLESHNGLSIFSKERAKFEGWLKVELCDSLSDHYTNIIPENNNIDICCDDWLIELKTVNTNYRYPTVKNKHRPITMNVQGVIDDIKKLRNRKSDKKAVMFIVFPTTEEKKEWQTQLNRIKSELKDLRQSSFTFKENIPGVMYFGTV